MLIAPSRPYGSAEMVEELRASPDEAAMLLNDVLEDGDSEELETVLSLIAKAFGGVQQLAEQANAKGMRLAIQPVTHAHA